MPAPRWTMVSGGLLAIELRRAQHHLGEDHRRITMEDLAGQHLQPPVLHREIEAARRSRPPLLPGHSGFDLRIA